MNTGKALITGASRGLGRALAGGGDAVLVDAPTHHHQGVDQLGDGLVATAWTADGTVEGLEVTDSPVFAVGVQWHPEEGTDPRLFEALVTAAAGVTDGVARDGSGELDMAVS